jgi:hypothetical protein
MMPASEPSAVIARHHGAGRISAILPERIEARGNANLQLLDPNGAPVGEPVTVGLRTYGDFARLRARIDPGMAPGMYAAELRVDGGVRRLTVAIDPLVRLTVDPPVLRLAGEAGTPMRSSIVLANQGNVAAELPDHGAVGVYEVNGVETAIGRAYRSDTEDGLQTISRFIQELRSGYGGLVKLRLGGAGALAPGKARNVEVTATLSERVRAGHVYTGVWSLLNLNYAVRIEVGGNPAPGGAARSE